MKKLSLVLIIFLSINMVPRQSHGAAQVAASVVCGPAAVGCAILIMGASFFAYQKTQDLTSAKKLFRESGGNDSQLTTISSREFSDHLQDIRVKANQQIHADKDTEKGYGDPDKDRWYLVGQKDISQSKVVANPSPVRMAASLLVMGRLPMKPRTQTISREATLKIKKGPMTFDECLVEYALVAEQFGGNSNGLGIHLRAPLPVLNKRSGTLDDRDNKLRCHPDDIGHKYDKMEITSKEGEGIPEDQWDEWSSNQ